MHDLFLRCAVALSAFALLSGVGCDLIGSKSLSAPENLRAASNDGQIQLEWDRSATNSPDGYRVYRSTSSFDDVEAQSPVTDQIEATGFSDTTVANGTTYYYRVTTVLDDRESRPSDQVSVTPFSKPIGRP